MKLKKLIELWKNDCVHCKAVKPLVDELEKEGIEIERINTESPEALKIFELYTKEIDAYNEKMGYDLGSIYTPTFINPFTKKILSLSDREPTKEELTALATK